MFVGRLCYLAGLAACLGKRQESDGPSFREDMVMFQVADGLVEELKTQGSSMEEKSLRVLEKVRETAALKAAGKLPEDAWPFVNDIVDLLEQDIIPTLHGEAVTQNTTAGTLFDEFATVETNHGARVIAAQAAVTQAGIDQEAHEACRIAENDTWTLHDDCVVAEGGAQDTFDDALEDLTGTGVDQGCDVDGLWDIEYSTVTEAELLAHADKLDEIAAKVRALAAARAALDAAPIETCETEAADLLAQKALCDIVQTTFEGMSCTAADHFEAVGVNYDSDRQFAENAYSAFGSEMDSDNIARMWQCELLRKIKCMLVGMQTEVLADIQNAVAVCEARTDYNEDEICLGTQAFAEAAPGRVTMPDIPVAPCVPLFEALYDVLPVQAPASTCVPCA